MPTYDYECQACGHAFEKFQMMSDRVLRKCPKCGQPKLTRLIGPGGGVLFKGPGFYATDYRSKGYREAAKAEGGNGTAEGGKAHGDGTHDTEAPLSPSSPSEKKAEPRTEKKRGKEEKGAPKVSGNKKPRP